MILFQSSLDHFISHLQQTPEFAGCEIALVEQNDTVRVVNQLLPEILVVDADTPNSTQIVKAIRRRKRLNKVLILATTSSDVAWGILNIGVDIVHTNSHGVEVFLARLRNLLKKSKSMKSIKVVASTRVGSITIIPETLVVIFDSRAIALTLMEYKLLAFLAANHNQAVKVSTLIKEVWGDIGNENRIRMVVFLLRKKLHDSKPFAIIKRSRGGYMLTS